ncbi:MAG TPA: hypothetical protein VI547_00640 [Anaerolineales bacterium]|nr:hypothetical protein [Anaerolineales bacterium]
MAQPNFPLELDHVVVFCSVDAPEARRLEEIGLQGFGGVTRHGDLGSASTAFFFSNLVYLGLLWIHDEEAARGKFEPATMNTIPRMHWRTSGASPINLMLRRRQPGATDPPPFPTHPLQFGDASVGFNGEVLTEPCYGVVPEALSFRGFRANIQDLPHPLGVKHLTGVAVTITEKSLSPIAQMLMENGIATFEFGAEPLLALTFDGGAQGRNVDVRATLPMVLKY